jgi:hypothetical protein
MEYFSYRNVFINNLYIWPLISLSDIFSINYQSVWRHYDVTDRNNYVSIEGLNVYVIGKLDIYNLVCATDKSGSLNWPRSTKIFGQFVTRIITNTQARPVGLAEILAISLSTFKIAVQYISPWH